MSRVTVRDIKSALTSIADGVLMDEPSRERFNAARSMQVSVDACASYRTVGAVGLRYAVMFEELGDYETANFINATLLEAI